MGLSKKKKIIIAVAGVVVVALGVKMASGGSNEPTGMPVTTSFSQIQDVEETIKLKAVLEGTESTEVVSRLHSEVTQLLVEEGDKVVKGQLLAVLDSTSITQELSLSRGENSLLQMQHAETLEDRQREYDKAKKEYDDMTALLAIGAASQTEVDDAKRKLDEIPSENGVAVLTPAEKQTQANASQRVSIQAKSLDDCQIRSMIDGTVTRVNTKVGRFADETEDDKPMFVIENIDKLQMRVLVDEVDIAKIEIGQKVDITADILDGEVVAGVVTRISPTGESKNNSSTERVIPVYIEVTEVNEKLIAGITVTATIHIANAPQAMTVPYEAVLEREDGSYAVYIVNEDNTISIVPVTIGLETDLLIEIADDAITEGQQVVLNPSLTLTEGMTVIPM